MVVQHILLVLHMLEYFNTFLLFKVIGSLFVTFKFIVIFSIRLLIVVV